MIALKPEKGKLLIAEPSIIGDVSFTRSVVILAEHNKDGTIGFILNKPLNFTITELIPKIKKPYTIFNGGPVEQDNLYFIHKIPQYLNNSIEIADGIYWGGDFEAVVSLINNDLIQQDDIKFFLGYSGWKPKQLEQELSENSWIIVENNEQSNIIEKSSTSFWREKIMELGGDYLIWSNAPENPNLN